MAAAPGLDPDSPAGTNFLVFIDDFFSVQRDRDRVLSGLGDGLWDHLLPADRVAAVAFDGRSAETLTPWTNEPEVWEEALERARARPAYGIHRLSELSQSEDDRQLQTQLEAVTDQDPAREQIEELKQLRALREAGTSADLEAAMAVEAALLFPEPPEARTLAASLSTPVRAGRGRMSVHAEVAISDPLTGTILTSSGEIRPP
ncbi:MAG: hypothetical protein OXG81_13395 [Acidobacteria bacterium]|nr:hypothetical protein [Acidobacteriota bacterium]MCY3930776.1 hypothetical protein [Acidobacteriota bacterium]